MKPWMRSRLRTADIRLGPGRGVVSLYSEIMPHMITRPKSLRRGKTGLLERRAEIGAAMIERRVEAELVLDVAAFVGPSRDADDPRALALCELPCHGADRARGGGDNDGLARLRLTDIGEADIGGHSRHAEDAERGRDRRLVRLELQEAIARNRAVELPAVAAHRVVVLAKAGMVRAHHLTDDAALDDLADLDGPGIGALSADAAAHIGIEREIKAAQ